MIADYIETGQVYYVFKDFPLTSIHPQAPKAAEAAECAGVQGAYWEMHDLLFAGQGAWSGSGNAVNVFVGYAEELGLDTEAFRTCLETGEFTAEVETDLAEGAAAGVRGTPTFVISGQLLVGAQPYNVISQAIEAALSPQ